MKSILTTTCLLLLAACAPVDQSAKPPVPDPFAFDPARTLPPGAENWPASVRRAALARIEQESVSWWTVSYRGHVIGFRCDNRRPIHSKRFEMTAFRMGASQVQEQTNTTLDTLNFNRAYSLQNPFKYDRVREVNDQLETTLIKIYKSKATAEVLKDGRRFRRSFNVTDTRVRILDLPWGLDYERQIGATLSFDAIDPDRLEVVHCTTRIVEKRQAPDGSARYVLELTQENNNEKEKGLPIKILLDENWDVHEIATGSLRIVRGTRDEVLNALPSDPPVIDNSIPVHGASGNWPPKTGNAATIRFAAPDAGDAPLLADSAYQKATREGKTWTVVLQRVTQVPGEKPPPAASRLPVLMIEADDPDIQAKANEIALALALAGNENHKDRRALMLRLARWVAGHVTKPGGPPLASARAALRSGQGDCTEHAYLLCALARARGIPARAAFGLIYKDGRFVFHAWTEARIQDRWLPYDTTRDRYGALPARYILLDYDYGQSSDPAVLGLVAQMMEVRRIDVVPEPYEQ